LFLAQNVNKIFIFVNLNYSTQNTFLMKLHINIFLLLSFLSFQFINAQTTDQKKLSLESGTIDDQFEYVIQKSGKYQDFKVVKRVWLYTLKAHTLDSLNAVRKELTTTLNKVDTQAKEISDLKQSLSNTNTTLNNTIEEKNSMSLFGMQMSKSAYSTFMWGIIVVLLILLAFFVYRFNNSNSLTKDAKRKLNDVEAEYEDHRRVALEREQKVRRQLQDEINKNKAKS